MLTLQKQFERHLLRGRFFNSQDKVVVAVSTGVDSMVLLDLLQGLPAALRPQLIVAHVNHELRSQSIEEEAYLKSYCKRHHLCLEIKHWPQSEHPQTGVENAARQVRYQFFAQVMQKNHAKILVTAHHQNDLAETMLMKLTRGGQLSQLVGIADSRPFAKGRLVRPLLPFSKGKLTDYARARKIKWYEDETNTHLDVQRNRFRHEVLPLLEKENPRLLEHLASYHRQLAALLSWQAAAVNQQLKIVVDDDRRLVLPKLFAVPQAAQPVILAWWLNINQVYDVKSSQIADLLQLFANRQTPQQQVELPGDFVVVKDYQFGLVKDRNKLSQELQKVQPRVIELEQWYSVDDTRQLAVATNKQFFSDATSVMPLWLAPAQLPLTLRKWELTDELRLRGGKHQRIKRVLINQKVPQSMRTRQLVLVDAQGEVVWLLDRKWSWFDRPKNYRQRWLPVIIGIKDEEEKKDE